MRYNIIKTMIKKELKDIFRDKKTIFTMIILPVLLYPLLMVGSSQLMVLVQKEMHEATFQIAIEDTVPAQVKQLIEEEEQLEVIAVEDYKVALEEEQIKAYLSFEKAANESFEIYYDGSDDKSSRTSEIVEDVLDDYKDLLIEERIKEVGLESTYVLEPITYSSKNMAKDEEMAGYFLAMILPFILLISIASGAVYPAIDVMAGEKERGTIETLLTLPVSNLELIVGKYVAVAVVALMSAFLNLLSIGASMGLMFASIFSMSDMGGASMPTIQMSQFILPLVITILTIFLFTLVVVAVSMSICALAKSFKEAQNYVTPMLFVIMIPAYATMIPTIELTATTASIPVVNIALLMKSVLMFEYDLALTAIVLVSNVALVIISIFILIKLFDSEEILFGSGREFAILQRRYNIQKGTMPTPSDAFMIYAVALLGLIYLGQILQVKLGFMGIAATQGIMVLIALGFAYYIKTDMKKTFSLKVPKIKHIIGSLILWMGTFTVVMVLSNLLLPLSSANEETLEALSKMLSHDNLWINVLVVALLPAICEELLFRGIIYKGIENGKHGRRAILVSALLFGLMHIDFIRIPTTALLGVALAYVVYKTGSIFLAMLIHFINNGFAVVVDRFGIDESKLGALADLPLWGWFIIGVMLVGISMLFFRKSSAE